METGKYLPNRWRILIERGNKKPKFLIVKPGKVMAPAAWCTHVFINIFNVGDNVILGGERKTGQHFKNGAGKALGISFRGQVSVWSILLPSRLFSLYFLLAAGSCPGGGTVGHSPVLGCSW